MVGNGNVALDVARILVTDPDVLAATDIADHALDSLRPRGVEEVVVLGRRGPLQAAFTTLELRELGDLEGVDVVVDPADFEGITDEDAAAAGKICKQNIKVLRGYIGRELRPGHRRIVFRFLTSPIEIKGDGKVGAIVLGRNELVTDDSGWVSAKDTGEREELPAQLVVRSVGYRGVPTPGLPFDEKRATIPNTDGRVDGSRNEYVVGWIKRGPTGVIGTQQEGLPGHRRHPARRPRRHYQFGAGRGLRRRPRRQAGRLARVAAAEAGHVGALGDHRPIRADGRRTAWTSPREAAQPGHATATSATPDQRIQQHARVENPGRIERRLGRTQRHRERVRTLPVVPRTVVATDRVVVGDGAAGRR